MFALYLYLRPLNSDDLQIYVLLGDMPFILLLKYNNGWRHEKVVLLLLKLFILLYIYIVAGSRIRSL